MDRSSEERSRFEKWTAKQIKAISPLWELERDGSYVGYVVRDPTEMVAILNRAALEDRQEAAPNAIGEIECRYCLRKVSEYRVDVDERKLCEFCWKSAHPEEPFRLGVPSEATPSKENAPPEVEDHAKFLALSLDLHKHGKGHDFGDAIRSYPSAKLHAWFDLGNKLNFDAPAPEGVQGKEPQTFEAFWAKHYSPRDVFKDSHPYHISKTSFAEGEAAGRRSAITPEQVEKMREGCHATYNGGHHDAIPYEAFHHGMDTVFNVLKARAERECAELLEKTKP